MKQVNNSIKKQYSQLKYYHRQLIEKKYGTMSISQIARELCVNKSTISREIKRGLVEQRSVKFDEITKLIYGKKEYITKIKYSADVAQKSTDYNKSSKGCRDKLGKNHEFAKAVRDEIKQGYSPYAALQRIKNYRPSIYIDICVGTLYNYIDKEWIDGVTNKDLWQKSKKKKKKKKKVRLANNNLKGESIEKRPEEVESREEQGHWEFDLVVGKKRTKTVLLTMVERLSRNYHIIKLPNKKQETIAKSFDKLEKEYGAKRFREVFKTMTCDNGTEFLDFVRLEKSAINKKKPRTKIYYCHPYCSWERGSNEVGHRFIRRIIPKGVNIGKYSDKEIKEIEEYMNNYPRKILDGKSAKEIFNLEDASTAPPTPLVSFPLIVL